MALQIICDRCSKPGAFEKGKGGIIVGDDVVIIDVNYDLCAVCLDNKALEIIWNVGSSRRAIGQGFSKIDLNS